MREQFIPYEQALALKELGFDESCLGNYRLPSNRLITEWEIQNTPSNALGISAPLYQQAFRWLKEKYGLMSCTTPCSDGEYIFTLYDLNKCDLEVFVEDIEIMESEDSYEFFEEAELECLKKLIEIVKLSHKTATI